MVWQCCCPFPHMERCCHIRLQWIRALVFRNVLHCFDLWLLPHLVIVRYISKPLCHQVKRWWWWNRYCCCCVEPCHQQQCCLPRFRFLCSYYVKKRGLSCPLFLRGFPLFPSRLVIKLISVDQNLLIFYGYLDFFCRAHPFFGQD